MIVLVDWKQYIICKEIFIFCDQFKKKPTTDFNFLIDQKELLLKEPQLTSYFYQFLFESAYHKKKFNNYDIVAAFDNQFKIQDIYNLNGSMSDAATINTAFIAHHIATKSLFKNLPVTIISNPLDYKSQNYTLLKKYQEIQDFRDLSQKRTGQPNCDLLLNDRHYDIKHTTKENITKNFIYPQTFDTIEKNGLQHLKNLYYYLSNKKTFNKDLLYKLHLIINEKNLTNYQKNNLWNELLADNMKQIPKELSIPIILNMTNKPFSNIIPKEVRESYQISYDVVDNHFAARKAISGVLNKWDNIQYKKNAMIMTENGLPFLFNVDESLNLD